MNIEFKQWLPLLLICSPVACSAAELSSDGELGSRSVSDIAIELEIRNGRVIGNPKISRDIGRRFFTPGRGFNPSVRAKRRKTGTTLVAICLPETEVELHTYLSMAPAIDEVAPWPPETQPASTLLGSLPAEDILVQPNECQGSSVELELSEQDHLSNAPPNHKRYVLLYLKPE